jgi:GNAT superfamily N-acetyltransferase
VTDGELRFRACHPDDAPASELLSAMEAEMVELYQIPPDGMVGGMRDHGELGPPAGRYLVGWEGDSPVAGGGLRRLDNGIAEIKRMYVLPSHRGRGIAVALLDALERAAGQLGYHTLRLDTGARQPHAEQLYVRRGYRAVVPFNRNQYASFWGEKVLTPPSGVLEIRPALAADAERAGEVVVRAYHALLGEQLGAGYAAQLADVAGRLDQSEVLVATMDGEVLGSVTFVADESSPMADSLRPGEAGIRMLAVDPEAQRCGLGRALVSACLERARALGKTGVFLYSMPEMVAAHHLYQALGFTRAVDRDWTAAPDSWWLAFARPLVA